MTEWMDNLGELNGKYGFDLLQASTATLAPTGTVWTGFQLLGTGCLLKASPATVGDYISTDGAATGGQVKWKSPAVEAGPLKGRYNAVLLSPLATPGTGSPVLLAYRSKP